MGGGLSGNDGIAATSQQARVKRSQGLMRRGGRPVAETIVAAVRVPERERFLKIQLIRRTRTLIILPPNDHRRGLPSLKLLVRLSFPAPGEYRQDYPVRPRL